MRRQQCRAGTRAPRSRVSAEEFLFSRRIPLFVAAVVLLAAHASVAQQSITTASISGRVTDPSGVAVPGATVTARNLDRNQDQSVVTTSQGGYRFLSLPVGRYEVRATVAGMTSRRRS